MSTVGCKDGEINIYDSLPPAPTSHLMNQIAALLATPKPAITVKYMDTQMQCGSTDCGIFVIVFAAAPVASEAYRDWSGEAAGTRLRVNFTLKLLLSQNFCNLPLMRFISFASNIGPAAAIPAGPAPAPLH